MKEQEWLQLVLGVTCVAVAYVLWSAFRPEVHLVQDLLVALQHGQDAIDDWLDALRRALN